MRQCLLMHSTSALVIVRTNLQKLGLQSLRSIPLPPDMTIFIGLNSRLCYAETVNWMRITGRANATRLKLNSQQCGTLCLSYEIRVPMHTGKSRNLRKEFSRTMVMESHGKVMEFYQRAMEFLTAG